MNSLIVGLTLVGGAAAQYVNGASMVPAYQANYYTSSADASSTVTAAPQYTSAASSSSMGSADYSSFMSGGYSSMNCGYGYSKASNGACSQQSWYQTSGCYETIIINNKCVVFVVWSLSPNCYSEDLATTLEVMAARPSLSP